MVDQYLQGVTLVALALSFVGSVLLYIDGKGQRKALAALRDETRRNAQMITGEITSLACVLIEQEDNRVRITGREARERLRGTDSSGATAQDRIDVQRTIDAAATEMPMRRSVLIESDEAPIRDPFRVRRMR